MLHHVAGLVLNTPLMALPGHVETVLSVLGDRAGIDAAGLAAGSGGARLGSREPKIVGNGTLLIPVVGTLTHRATGMQAASGVMDYGALEAVVEEGMQSSDVRSILFDHSSPGGAVSGAFDLRDYLMEQRGRKPMAAIARDMMASASYLLGSATDRVFATQTSTVGSIGVVMAHIDESKRLEMEGVKPTFIHAGAMKVAGNSAEPLSEEVRSELQESVDETYDMFVSAVSASRGLSPEAVRGTEARVYSGATAVGVGLADEVATLASAIESIGADAPRSYPSMSIQGNSDMNEDELRAEGATAERARIQGILGHDSAKGRAKLANHLAFNTDMSVEAAGPMLAASAVEPDVAPVADTEALNAKDAEIARLKAAMGSDQANALKSMAADGANVDAAAGDAGGQVEDPVALRTQEAVANMRLLKRK
jgi:signal peptide peptidase SppA